MKAEEMMADLNKLISESFDEGRKAGIGEVVERNGGLRMNEGTNAIDYLRGYEEGELAGVKKVVDWIHSHNIETEGIDGLEDAWDKQLKDWGIENEAGD